MKAASLLTKEAVLPCAEARDKKQALKLLAAQAAKPTGVGEREIYSVLMARESIGCTGMGGGVSIPHGRFEGLKEIYAVFATLAHPVDFGAADGRPVDILCLLMTPAEANAEHLKALAVFSRLLRDKAVCARIRDAKDSEALYAVLTEEPNENP